VSPKADYMSALGVDLEHSGLYCRGGCRERFSPEATDSEAALGVAARLRDFHEKAVHQYVHVPEETTTWNFTRTTTRQGRSTLGRYGRVPRVTLPI
jgi:hypothetical protein